jgi:DNA repair protein RecO (recombination protein O)
VCLWLHNLPKRLGAHGAPLFFMGGNDVQLTIDGLVLRNQSVGQNRLLTLLTAQHGVLTAYVNQGGTMRSKLSASTEVLCYSRFVLFKGRSSYVVDKADSNRIFFGLRQEWDKLCLASYFAQLAAELCPFDEPAAQPLRLLLNTLHFLEKGNRDMRQLKALFELRLLTLTGFMPDLVSCRCCSEYERPEMLFFPAEGDLCCSQCAKETSAMGGMKVSPGVLAAMRHILYTSPEKLFSFTLGEEGLDALYQVSEQYLLAQVEKSFSALELYQSCRITQKWEPANTDETRTEDESK